MVGTCVPGLVFKWDSTPNVIPKFEHISAGPMYQGSRNLVAVPVASRYGGTRTRGVAYSQAKLAAEFCNNVAPSEWDTKAVCYLSRAQL
jgi:hypothetical protein